MIWLQQCTMEARKDPRSALRGSEEQLFKLLAKKQHQHKGRNGYEPPQSMRSSRGTMTLAGAS